MNNWHLIKNIVSFSIILQKVKYWCINLIKYEQDLYEENYKTLKNKIKWLDKWKESHVHSRKNQNCQDVSSFQLGLYSQWPPTKILASYLVDIKKLILKFIQGGKWKVKVLVAQLCPTLGNAIDCSFPGSSFHGILQVRILEWVAMPSSRGSSWSRDWTHIPPVSWIGSWILYHWATWETPNKIWYYINYCFTSCDLVGLLVNFVRHTKKALEVTSSFQ